MIEQATTPRERARDLMLSLKAANVDVTVSKDEFAEGSSLRAQVNVGSKGHTVECANWPIVEQLLRGVLLHLRLTAPEAGVEAEPG